MPRSLPIARVLSTVSAALAALCFASFARAQCSTDSLTMGVSEACLSPYRYTAAQDETFWAAVAVRSLGGDWDLELYSTLDPTVTPNCFSGPLATANLHDGYVDFIAGDFSTNLLRSYYLKAMHAAGSTSAEVEWDTGTNPNILVLNMPRVISFTPANVIECRDINLQANTTYRIQINALGGIQARAYVVSNPNQESAFPRWVARDSALALTTGVGSVTTDSAGFYGIIITNENAGTGSVSVLVGESLVGVGDRPGPGEPRISAVVPNPLRGRGAIAFDLPRAARVRIEVIDLAGRIVASREDEVPAGPGRWDWDGTSSAGASVRAGVYFARLVVDGRPADRAKLLFLP
jgi:hypothetical protein